MMQTGDEYFDSSEFKDILMAYEEAERTGQPLFMDTDDLIDIADYYSLTGNKDKASAAIEAALELNPGATLPLVFKAREALAHEDVEAAKELASSIIDKDDYDYKWLQAEIMVAQDKVDEADSYIKEVFATVEDDERDDSIYDIAGMYLDYGVYDKAYEWISECSETDNDECLDLRARALMGLGRPHESIAIYNTLIDRKPRSAELWTSLATAQYQDEAYGDAITSCEYALALNPNDTGSLFTKANSLHRLGNFEGALEYFKRYNNVAPPDGLGELNIGTTLLHLTRNDEALTHLRKAEAQTVKAKTGYEAQIYEAMSFAYSSMGMADKAMEYVKKVPITDEDGEENASKLIVRGHILLEGGRIDEAEAVFRRAIISSGSSPAIILRVIVSLMDNKYTEVAYKMFKVYFSAFDDVTEGYSYMALCCWQLQYANEFVYYLKNALIVNKAEATTVLASIIPQDVELHDYLDNLINNSKNTDK